jgi:vacuolar protein sorting-associated protein 18
MNLEILLQQHDKDVDRSTILALMAGHNRTDELLYYWRTIGEWGKIVSHHMNRGEWSDAVSAILDAPSSSSENDQNSQENLWYRHSSVLMGMVPAETVEGWKGCLELKPARLIPTLVRYEQVKALATDGSKATHSSSTSLHAVAESLDIAMLYLEWAVRTGVVSRNKKDPSVRAVHNLLLSLYARQPAEDLLLRYIEEQSSHMPPVPPAGAAGSISEHGMSSALAVELAEREHEEAERNAREGLDQQADYSLSSGPLFDLTYALRVCLTAGKQRACVLLYCCMGLYVEAVDLALKVDVGLAKEAADRPPKKKHYFESAFGQKSLCMLCLQVEEQQQLLKLCKTATVCGLKMFLVIFLEAQLLAILKMKLHKVSRKQIFLSRHCVQRCEIIHKLLSEFEAILNLYEVDVDLFVLVSVVTCVVQQS